MAACSKHRATMSHMCKNNISEKGKKNCFDIKKSFNSEVEINNHVLIHWKNMKNR